MAVQGPWRWTIISEIFAVIPNTGPGGSSNFHFDGGAQFTVNENLIISALLGCAAGHHSPDLTSYLGMTVVFESTPKLSPLHVTDRWRPGDSCVNSQPS